MTDRTRSAHRLLAALDLTSLGETDDLARIRELCAAAATPFGSPAAVCVYPEWVVSARAELDRRRLGAVRVATVVNFPDGGDDPERCRRETQRAVAAGADEIDLVFPYRALRAGADTAGQQLMQACREACGERTMKVILETGELGEPGLIRAAARLAIEGGADFLKTSTGKVSINATPEAAAILLDVLRQHGGRCGLKVAGGIRRFDDARAYLELVDRSMGTAWATPARFRVGASTLLDELLAILQDGERARDD